VYQEKDAPYYKNGNKVLIALAVVSGFLFIFAKFYYDWWNRYSFRTRTYKYRAPLLTVYRRNTAKWDAMTSEQREFYLRENPVLTNKRYVAL
jgi:hypothetical protein